MRLQGEGLAEMRNAIANGQEENIRKIAEKLGIPFTDAMNYLVEIMRIDAMKELGNSNNSKVIFYPIEDSKKLDFITKEILRNENN